METLANPGDPGKKGREEQYGERRKGTGRWGVKADVADWWETETGTLRGTCGSRWEGGRMVRLGCLEYWEVTGPDRCWCVSSDAWRNTWSHGPW